MSLQSRLNDLISSIGADIKALQNRTGDQHSTSIQNQVISGNTDTYVAGSRVTIPQGKIKASTKYRCVFNVVKTAAGTAAPVVTLRIGTAGTTSDVARCTFTFAAQTGAIDEGVIELECVFRVAGASAVIQAFGRLFHRLVTTGLNVTAANTTILSTSAAFDVTGAGLGIGVSVNAGASSNWTVSLVTAELVNLTP